jgi:endo-1,4-beta-xylanase
MPIRAAATPPAAPSRRAVVSAGACAVLAAGTQWAAAAAPSLADLAARSGRFFGAALTSALAVDAGPSGRLLMDECSVWVPEWELKWGALARDLAGPTSFAAVDRLVAAARRAGKRLRGHTLLWHQNLPAGVADLTTRADWDRVVAPHVTAVAGRYADAMFQWDVVNEAIEPRDGGADRMRRTPFYRMLGPDYVAESFRLAHAAAPAGRLYLNDYNVCYADGWQEPRRAGLLRLLERLRAAGVPVHGLGIQAHLDTRFRFEPAVFRGFLGTVAGMGLEIAITELDVREADGAGGRSLAARRQRAADEVERVLAVALDSPALVGVATWGLTDRESWLRKSRPLPDNQGLPYDDALSPTPMRETLAALFAAARIRHD